MRVEIARVSPSRQILSTWGTKAAVEQHHPLSLEAGRDGEFPAIAPDRPAQQVLGAAAGLCTVGSFVPQVVKAWREGDTNAISLRMYLVLVAGFVLWLGYGLLIGSWPIILVNLGNLALSAVILWLKLRDGKRAGLGRITTAAGENA